ncbi:MAG: HDIG domain-containing protein, partial [Gemmatimonadetes bacterium]|nr:HDIG domain-containing protein [Gemmatimonadota bacterium]
MTPASERRQDPSFFEMLSRPPRRTWPDRVVHHGARVLLLVVLAGAVTALFLPTDRMQVERYEVGMVAEESVIAQVPFSVPKTPGELERDRAEAMTAVPPTFNYEPQMADSVESRLEGFFRRMAVVSDTGSMANLQGLLQGSSIQLTPDQTELLRDPENFRLLRDAALQAAREMLPLGVVDGAELEQVTTESITVRQETEQGDLMERSVDTAQVVSTREFLPRAVGLLPAGAPPDLQQILRLVLIQFVEPTYRPNVPATELDRDAASRSVPTTKQSVLEGEAIVRANEAITPATLEKLTAYEEQLRTRGMLESEGIQWAPLVGAALLNLLVLSVFGLLVFFFRQEIYHNFRWMALMALLVAAYFAVAAVIAGNALPPELLPIAFVALAVSVLWDGRMALVLVLVLAVLTVMQQPFGRIPILVVTLVGGASAALSVRAVRRRAQTWIFVAIIAAAYSAVLLALVLSGQLDPASFWVSAAAAGGNAVLSAVLAMGFLPVFELFTGITTDQTLLEWADPNRSLLKRLSMEAPGTYAHTINVANLAESAANVIGANGLLCRVGLYYHDVGKMLKPHYFVENQPDGRNPHDRLKPDTSAAIVKEHVVEGYRMAREAKVPDVVADFIPEHHGTQRIGFFWEKAREEYGEESLKPEDFTYPGPRPRSRETAIAMLADSVESATRALQDPTPERVRDLIHNIVEAKIADGQLDEAPLTLREVAQIKEQFVKVLAGIYHHRIDYPQTKHLTDAPDRDGEGPEGDSGGESGEDEGAEGGADEADPSASAPARDADGDVPGAPGAPAAPPDTST